MLPGRIYKTAALSFALLFVACAGPLFARGDSDFWENFVRIATLRDYNTRVVIAGSMLLGVASGLVGTFLVLRKRALLSDAVSHATLPGVVLAFLVASALGANGKSLPILLLGAAVTGVLGMVAVSLIRQSTRLRDDAALGIVLSVFFGIGIALLQMASRGSGNSAGLESFIYGKTASMLYADAVMIGVSALVISIASLCLYKEFALICFDADFATTEGWPVYWLDFLLMALVVGVTVIGLQAVGLILVVAMLVIPPSAARFWTHRLGLSLVIAALFGGLSGLAGSALSAMFINLPSGAVIVLTAAAVFFVSLIFGTERGILWRMLRHRNLARKIERQHLLRALYELCEGATREAVSASEICSARSWSQARVKHLLHWATRQQLVAPDGGHWRLTDAGRHEAMRLVRNHRLWEMYLLEYADIAPAVVDRDADRIEHILDEELIDRLEEKLAQDKSVVPASPHSLRVEGTG